MLQLIMSSNRFFFGYIPEPARAALTEQLKLQDLHQAKQVCKIFFNLFEKPFADKLLSKLISAVLVADYEIAKKIVIAKPPLIFSESKYKNGKTTPLKLALFLLDTYMWKCIFWEIIKDNAELREIFLQQKQTQQNHINLTPFFQAYQIHQKIYLQWKKMAATDAEVHQAWLEVGKLQHTLLPRHMYKEFVRNNLGHMSNFNVDINPAPLINAQKISVFDNDYRKLYELYALEEKLFAGLGERFALYKVRMMQATANGLAAAWYFEGGFDSNDVRFFQELYQVRKNDWQRLPAVFIDEPASKRRKLI